MCLLRAQKLLFSIELETLQSISSDSINLKLVSEDKNITDVKNYKEYMLYIIYIMYMCYNIYYMYIL